MTEKLFHYKGSSFTTRAKALRYAKLSIEKKKLLTRLSKIKRTMDRLSI